MKTIHRQILGFLLTLVVLTSSVYSSPPSAGAFICIPHDVVSTVVGWLPDWLENMVTTPDPWYKPEICEFKDRVMDPPEEEMYGERYTFAQVGWIIQSTIIHVLYPLFEPLDAVQNFFTVDNGQNLPPYTALGAPGILMGSIHQMYLSPPASALQSAKQTLAKFSLIKPVHAQYGYGYQSITAVQNLWIASRNSAYFFLVLLLVAAGFMIIFRVKINPQASVTIQLMIPRIITTLIFITFSYAIAGFVIDMVFVILSLIISSMAGHLYDIADTSRMLSYFADPGFGNIFFYYLVILGVLTVVLLPTFLGSVVSLLLLVVVLWLLFKIWWMMMKTFVMIIFQIIIGPWQIMLGLLPGQQGFGPWIRNLIANASVFIVVPLMFLMNMVLWATTSGGFSDVIAAVIGLFNFLFTGDNLITNNILTPGAYNFPELPLFGAHGTLFHLGIGYTILSLIPKTAEMVRDALKIPAFKYGSAVGEALGPVIDPATRKMDYLTSVATKNQDPAAFISSTISDGLKAIKGGRI